MRPAPAPTTSNLALPVAPITLNLAPHANQSTDTTDDWMVLRLSLPHLCDEGLLTNPLGRCLASLPMTPSLMISLTLTKPWFDVVLPIVIQLSITPLVEPRGRNPDGTLCVVGGKLGSLTNGMYAPGMGAV